LFCYSFSAFLTLFDFQRFIHWKNESEIQKLLDIEKQLALLEQCEQWKLKMFAKDSERAFVKALKEE